MPAKKKKTKKAPTDYTTLGMFLVIIGTIFLLQTTVPHNFIVPFSLIFIGALMVIRKNL